MTAAGPSIPQAVEVWSTVLDADAPDPPISGSEITRLNSVAIAGDRVVALFEVQPDLSHGGRPVRRFRLLSLDLKTGEAKGQRFVNSESVPHLFATDDEHLLMGAYNLTQLNPDLTDGGAHFTATSSERVISIAPDGSTLALWSATGSSAGPQTGPQTGPQQTGAETDTGTGARVALLNADTLTLSGAHFSGPKPTANEKDAILTDNQHWLSALPGDLAFVTLIDGDGMHLLYHGRCGGEPEFLAATKILFLACGKAEILDRSGAVLKELPLTAPYNRFAGVARDGSKFAIESSDYPIGDPSPRATEVFTLYDAQSFAPLATVTPDTLPEELSWSAFSKDGSQFVCGGPKKLSLYKIP